MRRKSALNNSAAGIGEVAPDDAPPTRTAEGVARRSAVAEEQAFLDLATARRNRLVDHLQVELSSEAQDALERARQRMLRQQYEELRGAREGLVFGRLDGLDGTVRHVGRVGLRNDGEDGEPLLVDWRAPRLGRSTPRRLSTHKVRHDVVTYARRVRPSSAWTTSHWTGR
ncbi:hypothetical protein GCM10027614_20500 [Micromonospora vulcania]